MNNTAEMFNAAAVATRVATVMQVIGGIPPIPNPTVKVQIMAGIGFPALYAPEVNLVALRPEVAFAAHGTAMLAHELCHAQQGLWGDVAATRPGASGLVRYALCPFERQARRVEIVAALLKGKFLTASPDKLAKAAKMANVLASYTELYLIGVGYAASKLDRRWRRKLLEPFGFWREE